MVCTVCHESQFARSSQNGSHPVALQCGHVFHKTCIDEWFRCTPQPACPLCHKAHTTSYIPLYVYEADSARRSSAGKNSSRATVHEVNGAPTQFKAYNSYTNGELTIKLGINNPTYIPPQENLHGYGQPTYESYSNTAQTSMAGYNRQVHMAPMGDIFIQQNEMNENLRESYRDGNVNLDMSTILRNALESLNKNR